MKFEDIKSGNIYLRVTHRQIIPPRCYEINTYKEVSKLESNVPFLVLDVKDPYGNGLIALDIFCNGKIYFVELTPEFDNIVSLEEVIKNANS